MAEMKRCSQCGILKDVSEFRVYTYSKNHSTAGHYRICKACENMNSQYRRSKQLLEAALQEPEMFSVIPNEVQLARDIVQSIEALYVKFEAMGCRIPSGSKSAKSSKTLAAIKQLQEFYAEKPKERTPVELTPAAKSETSAASAAVEELIVATQSSGLPDDLALWLDGTFAQWEERELAPDFLQETVYPSLKEKYRPQTGFDKELFIPIYDDTWKAALNRILKKFDDYEEYVCQKEGQ